MDERRPGAWGERLHQRVWQLLPWYANGTLAAAEGRTVEEHLAACSRCSEEAARCRELARAVGAEEEVAPSPHPVQLTRLLARIDEAESGSGQGGGRLRPGRLAGLLGATPAAVRGLVAAQLAAVLVLALLLAWVERQPPPPPASVFHTLSEAPEPSSRTASRTAPDLSAATLRLRVVFAETATERRIRKVLAAVRGQIVAGPSPLGAYTVEVPAGTDSLQLVLAHLRSRPEVAFAEPVDGGRATGSR